MNKQLKVADHRSMRDVSQEVIFDRSRLVQSTMSDVNLQSEILTLFIDQLSRIDYVNWATLDLSFEMHALRGSASAVGALQIDAICTQWQDFGCNLETSMKEAIAAFCTEATRH